MNEPAAHRIGHPHPLIFHLSAALAGYQLAVASAIAPEDLKFEWPDDLPHPPKVDPFSLTSQAVHRLREVEDGISAWQYHSYRRISETPPIIWSSGSTRLLDYASGSSGQPVLVVPSLINRAYILDLDADCSLMRFLTASGFHPFLIDWGDPGIAEQNFNLDQYVMARLLPAAAFLQGFTGKQVSLVGYCMGGTLATGLAARMEVTALATIGAPWEYTSDQGFSGRLRSIARQTGAEKLRLQIDMLVQAFGFVPDWLIQQLFALVKPFDAARKFRKFAQIDPQSAEALKFVSLEDWLADGIALAGPAANNLLIDWQVNNDVSTGKWHLMGRPLFARDVSAPALIITGLKDTIATPEMAQPLASAISNAQLLKPNLGHVGMIVGRDARKLVWEPLAEFLQTTAGH